MVGTARLEIGIKMNKYLTAVSHICSNLVLRGIFLNSGLPKKKSGIQQFKLENLIKPGIFSY